jgi:purine-binding chemotaxis protein CheW
MTNDSKSSAAPGPAAPRQIVTFRVEDRSFGIDVRLVREIKGWQATTPLPHTPPHVVGVINLRGVILAIYDLRARIGLGPTTPTPAHVVLVADVGERPVGLLVDTVSDIINLPAEAIRPAPDVGGEVGENAAVECLAVLDDGIVALLRLEHVIGSGLNDIPRLNEAA